MITAAHCEFAVGMNAKIGLHCKFDNNCNQTLETIVVTEVHNYPWFEKLQGAAGDFALLKLAYLSNAPPIKMDLEGISFSYTNLGEIFVVCVACEQLII